ncbi:hypothetical protein I6J24_10095 [Corynebacterium kroppenstedtii]|nr:hypothetical protein [Corynebacterium kroppenstedtii]QRP14384.1 hypothetical protein I6J24_10095 [Corynebacterium kroppenstedtii]HJD69092.1 hypothetical protein [Corynebacterium kroppenstedtii]
MGKGITWPGPSAVAVFCVVSFLASRRSSPGAVLDAGVALDAGVVLAVADALDTGMTPEESSPGSSSEDNKRETKKSRSSSERSETVGGWGGQAEGSGS